MKHLVLLPFFLVVLLLLQSCTDETLIYEPQRYAYLQHSSFSVDTSVWQSQNKISYTVTMQNTGTASADIIRTQLLYKHGASNEVTSAYTKWTNSDGSNVTIPAGGSVTYTLNDTLTWQDSLVYFNLSYNSNPINNLP